MSANSQGWGAGSKFDKNTNPIGLIIIAFFINLNESMSNLLSWPHVFYFFVFRYSKIPRKMKNNISTIMQYREAVTSRRTAVYTRCSKVKLYI